MAHNRASAAPCGHLVDTSGAIQGAARGRPYRECAPRPPPCSPAAADITAAAAHLWPLGK